jgi:hypothetical protein
LFPESLQEKYKVLSARLTEVGAERIRLVDHGKSIQELDGRDY